MTTIKTSRASKPEGSSGSKPLEILRGGGTARLPPELCDMVVDFLHNDNATLSICTLVCRSWLRAARYHLFEFIQVHRNKGLDAFVTYLKETPSVRAYIKDLSVDGFNEGPGDPDIIDSAFLAAVSTLLPQVHTISVFNCQWGPPESDTEPTTTPTAYQPISLERLAIHSFIAESEDPRHKFRVLRHFAEIGHLHLANIWLGHFAIDDDTMDQFDLGHAIHSGQPTHVERLTLSMSNICLNFLEYLRVQPFMKSLFALHIKDLFHAEYLRDHEDLWFVGEFLRGPLQSSLRDFHLELPRLWDLDTVEIYGQLSLSHCTALTSINLWMPRRWERNIYVEDPDTEDQATQVEQGTTHPEPQPGQPAAPAQVEQGVQTEPAAALVAPFSKEEWKAPVYLLSRVPPSIVAVSLHIEFEDTPEDLEQGLDWKALEDALLKLPKLVDVYIRKLKKNSTWGRWTKAQHDLIIRKLPTLTEKKMLCLCS